MNNLLHRSLISSMNSLGWENKYFTLRALSDGVMTLNPPNIQSKINPSLVSGYIFNEPFTSSCEIIVDINNLVDIDYGIKGGDYFYEYGFETNPDGLTNQLCIYKSDEELYLDEGVDYNDVFFHCGVERVDGVTYDKWRKAERDNIDEPLYWASGNVSNGEYYILTKRVTIDISSSYSINEGEWIPFYETVNLSLNKGDDVRVKCITDSFRSNKLKSLFDFTCDCDVCGNIMSLVYGDNFKGQTDLKSNAFYNLFKNCTTLRNAKNLILPATTLGLGCYSYMFSGCTNLITAPELPATTLTLGGDCYSHMFSGCTSLTFAPQRLPATALGIGCYSYMFSGCTSLTTAPELPATTLADGCYEYMFQGCKSLTAAPNLYATTLGLGCYAYMFSGCTSLTTAPELPATTLASNCYSSMFSGCTSLTTPPALISNTLADGCYSSMFSGCTSLTIAPLLPAMTLASGCYEYMFNGCTSLTIAPALSATTLVYWCYQRMFYNCSNLSEIWMCATDINATGCLFEWVKGVKNTGIFYKDIYTSLPSGISGIPTGWQVYNNK